MTALRTRSTALALVAALAAPSWAGAQAPAPPRQPAPAAPAKPVAPAAAKPAGSFHINAYGLFAFQQFTAKESFDAVFGHSSKGVFGAGAQVWHRSGLFAQAEYSQMKDEGQRVFVNGGTVFPLGISLRAELEFFEFGVGYKFVRRVRPPKPATPPKPALPAATKPGGDLARWQRQPGRPAPAPAAAPPPRPGAPSKFRLTPYLGAAFGRVTYAEFGDFAQGDENPSGSHSSYLAFAGVEIPVWRWVGLNVEGAFRWVPDGLGEGGVSAEFNETDLGGPALRVKLTVGR